MYQNSPFKELKNISANYSKRPAFISATSNREFPPDFLKDKYTSFYKKIYTLRIFTVLIFMLYINSTPLYFRYSF